MEQLIKITDAVFLGHVGEVELGASALAGIYYLATYMLGFGCSIGLQVMIARRNGEQDVYKRQQLPLEELGNQRISTFESGGIFNDSLAERLCEQPYMQDKIRLIESFVTQALCTSNKIEKQISYAVDCINLSKGQLPIRSLLENVCLSQRHFERKFKH